MNEKREREMWDQGMGVEEERHERRTRVRQLAIAGKSQRAIAAELGISKGMVGRDLAWLKAQKPDILSIRAVVLQELRDLDTAGDALMDGVKAGKASSVTALCRTMAQRRAVYDRIELQEKAEATVPTQEDLDDSVEFEVGRLGRVISVLSESGAFDLTCPHCGGRCDPSRWFEPEAEKPKLLGLPETDEPDSEAEDEPSKADEMRKRLAELLPGAEASGDWAEYDKTSAELDDLEGTVHGGRNKEEWWEEQIS